MLGAGPLGYKDWQRLTNWDDPVLIDQVTVKHTGLFQSPVLATARLAAVMGRMWVTTSPVQCTLEYFLDQAATKPCGKQTFVLDPTVSQLAQLKYPCLGPWLQISWQPKEEAESYLLTARVFLTNRQHPLILTPTTPVLVNANPLVAPGGGQVDAWPPSQYAGPIRIKGFSSQSWTVWLQAEYTPGFFTVSEVLAAAGNVNGFVTTIAPATAWKLTLINGGGAEANVNAVCWPSLTGSS